MSKIPTVFEPKGAFAFILACIKEYNPADRKTGIGPHIKSFLADPTIKELLDNSQAPAALAMHISQEPGNDIQAILKSLTIAINNIQHKLSTPPKQQPTPTTVKRSKGPSTTPTEKYLAIAGARPPNPSLVVDLVHLELAEDRPKPETICRTLNTWLGEVSLPQILLATVRWTARGNLVITGGPASTPATLQLVAPHISVILAKTFKLPSDTHLPTSRPNVKWSKISINSVPTSMSNKCMEYNPAECHSALTATNPSYTHLTVMQWPSWVCPPSSYSENAVSSLSVVFEDPDGSKLKAILAERYLYIFGTRATVKKWKHHPPIRNNTAQNPNAQYTTGNDLALEDNKDEVITHLTQTPWAETNVQTCTHPTSPPPPTSGIFGQYNAHQQTSYFNYSPTTLHHQTIFSGNSPVTPIPEPDQQQPQLQPLHTSKKAPPAPETETTPFSTPIAPTRTSGFSTPPPALACTRPPNPPRNAKGKKTVRAA
jgi:hypothetical protein